MVLFTRIWFHLNEQINNEKSSSACNKLCTTAMSSTSISMNKRSVQSNYDDVVFGIVQSSQQLAITVTFWMYGFDIGVLLWCAEGAFCLIAGCHLDLDLQTPEQTVQPVYPTVVIGKRPNLLNTMQDTVADFEALSSQMPASMHVVYLDAMQLSCHTAAAALALNSIVRVVRCHAVPAESSNALARE